MERVVTQNSSDTVLQPEVTSITTPEQLDALEPAWNALFDVSPTAVPPLRFSWVRAWWRLYGAAYGRGGAGLRVLAIWRGAALLGVLPLYLGRRSWGGIGLNRLQPVSAGAAEFEETSVD